MPELTIRTRRRMPRIAVCVDVDHLRAVDQIAAEAGALRSDVVRTAIEELVERRAATTQEIS